MKEAIIVNLDGYMIDVVLIEDAVTGVFPIYKTAVSTEIEATPLELELVGYQVAIPITKRLYRPRFDLEAWETYNTNFELDKQALLDWLYTPEEERSEFPPTPISGNPSDCWIEGKEFDLEQYKQDKINFLFGRYQFELNSEFSTNALGETPVYFSYDSVAQDRFTKKATYLSINPSANEIEWGTKYDGFVIMTREQFIQVLDDAAKHEEDLAFKYLYAEANIMNAEDKEVVDEIADSW